MESRKNNRNIKKNKKYKINKRTFVILLFFCVIITISILSIIYLNSEKYEKKKMEKLVSNWAEEYYNEELVNIASKYIKTRAARGENININLDALKNFGKDIKIVKNKKTGRQCDDIDTYISINVDKNAKDISKEYKIEKVFLDCFE